MKELELGVKQGKVGLSGRNNLDDTFWKLTIGIRNQSSENHLSIEYFCTCLEISIETFVEEIKPVVTEKKL